MTLEDLKKQRENLGMTYEELARRSGVPIGTVQKIFGGTTKAPRYTTMQKLENVLFPKKETSVSYAASKRYEVDRIREDGSAYQAKKQGEYTLEDYYRIPDERRVELIDGVIYDMASPRMIHQLIAGQIYSQLLACITSHNMDCVPFIAPADVQLDRDNRTMLQPDVFVVCDRSRILETHVYGAPDFTVEILSKSTRSKDMYLKQDKYRNAGVREYWIVDPDKKKVIVYLFGEEPDVNIYGFTDKIPVSISKGVCEIDFAKINDYVSFLS